MRGCFCYFLRVAIFTHWGYPLVIMTTVPLGIAGGIVGLALLNPFVRQPFDMITMPGFLIVLATVVNNPILMSTVTTVFGLAPLVSIPGAGTGRYRGVGIIVPSGLVFATLLTRSFLRVLPTTLLRLRVAGKRSGATPA